MSKKGNLIIISGPSGTGKGTVCKKLLMKNKNVFYSISATTRNPRPNEKNGREYWFTSKSDFEKMIKENKLLEWANVYGNYYGTPLDKINDLRIKGIDVLLEIDTQGALSVMRKISHGVFIFLLPPSLKELKRRICGRGTETKAVIERRFGAAVGEIELGKRYDYIVINRNINHAVEQINAIITAEHCKTNNNLKILDRVKNEEI
ncbi:guanylate kinase [Pectinatus sottacetonis]|uniref:guanylate kinase n=1 Tax=Pectinatus sottacetonis TaxID=1002795 RepID=UPI0018C5AF21|nr:guanylate kinase [Pectinatus sottacetonis]